MTTELFRFNTLRAAEPKEDGRPVIHVATSGETEVSDKEVEEFTRSFSVVAEAALSDDQDRFGEALSGVNEFDNLRAHRVLGGATLEAVRRNKDHARYAQAVRGVKITEQDLTEVADARPWASALLVAHRSVLAGEDGSQAVRRETRLAPEPVTELSGLTAARGSARGDAVMLRDVLDEVSPTTRAALGRAGFSHPDIQTVDDAITTMATLGSSSQPVRIDGPGGTRIHAPRKSGHSLSGLDEEALPGFKEAIRGSDGIDQDVSDALEKAAEETAPSFVRRPQPVGMSDLLVVRRQTVRYEPGEVAHIENAMAGESRERTHRRLDRSTERVLFEEETSKEETRDLETTERFELETETQRELEQQRDWQVSASVSASYGPTVDVGLEAGTSGSTARRSAERRATQFSREVVDKASTRISRRTRELRETITVAEVEETNRHGIEAPEDEHVVGVYQWVDKVEQAQVFDYGKRLVFDLCLPEPGMFLLHALERQVSSDPGMPDAPPQWALRPEMLTADNWLDWADRYGASDVDPPPQPTGATVATAIQPGGDKVNRFAHTDEVAAPGEGFQAVSATVSVDIAEIQAVDDDIHPQLVVSVADHEQSFGRGAISHGYTKLDSRRKRNIEIDALQTRDPESIDFDLDDLPPGPVPVAVVANGIVTGSATFHVRFEPTPAAVRAWRHTALTQIRQAHEAATAAYLDALERRDLSRGFDTADQPPQVNRKREREELKKMAITAFTLQHHNHLSGVTRDEELSYPQVDLITYWRNQDTIQFFEQAFEWQHMNWVTYPYYWARKATWLDRFGIESNDPQHMEFLRAGAARVQIPVRPGFEPSVLHYVSTGRVRKGGNAPEVYDEAYLPIVSELAEQLDAPNGAESPVGDPWEVRLPTRLVKLRDDGDLPRWHHVHGRWVSVDSEGANE